ncbi:10597_t:CDS:1, partial [Funneliformis mosseae]
SRLRRLLIVLVRLGLRTWCMLTVIFASVTHNGFNYSSFSIELLERPKYG